MRKQVDGEIFVATVPGEPVSKANSRQLVYINNTPRFIKSKKALVYSKNFSRLIPHRRDLLEGVLVVGIKIYYKTRRPDLDESLVLDLLEGIVYKNDRQVRRRIADHAIDKENPRAVIFVAPIDKTQEAFDFIMGLE